MGADSSPPQASEVAVPPTSAAEPTLEGAFASDGVDLTVIRWMLDRTPEERLQAVQQLLDAVWALRGRET